MPKDKLIFAATFTVAVGVLAVYSLPVALMLLAIPVGFLAYDAWHDYQRDREYFRNFVEPELKAHRQQAATRGPRSSPHDVADYR